MRLIKPTSQSLKSQSQRKFGPPVAERMVSHSPLSWRGATLQTSTIDAFGQPVELSGVLPSGLVAAVRVVVRAGQPYYMAILTGCNVQAISDWHLSNPFEALESASRNLGVMWNALSQSSSETGDDEESFQESMAMVRVEG